MRRDQVREYATKDEALAAITKALKESSWGVYPGISSWNQNKLWLTRNQIASKLYPKTVELALLRKMAKDGLIIERRDKHSTFTTVEMHAHLLAEQAMTDGERAERTAETVRQMWEKNVREYRDRADRMPVHCDLMGVPQDGIKPAVEGGLLVLVHGTLTHGHLVPAEAHDWWSEAVDALKQQTVKHEEQMQALRDRLGEYIGPAVGTRHILELTSGQIEALLVRLDAS